MSNRTARRLTSAIAALALGSISATSPSAEADDTEHPQVTSETSHGSFVLELDRGAAPETVENFLAYVRDGFYEGTIFHRVIAGFMIQTGGYDGALEYRTPPRQVVNESSNGLANRRWSVAMARHADPDSAGSQFYINLLDNQHLDATAEAPGYTVFGQLVAGFDVAEDIELTDTGTRGGMADVPVTHIVVQNARRVE